MADYSETPLDLLLANRQKGYVGIHIEQGVPVLDRDLNLLHDLISATVREVVTRYIGNGAPAGADGFGIEALVASGGTQDFNITAGAAGAGRALVGGLEVGIGATVKYRGQSGVPDLITPTAEQPDPRIDTVYLDVSLVEVDSVGDPGLSNSLDVGVQTSVRLKPSWVVRVAEGVPVPPPPPGHSFYPLAELARQRLNDLITPAMITDKRQRGLTVSDVERRLRRVENALLPTFVGAQFAPKLGFAGVPVTINGTNFNIGTVIVRFGEVVATSVTSVSPTQITVLVPRGVATGGVTTQVFISVENAAGRVFAGSAFTAQPAPVFGPSGSQFSPMNGVAGATVTLNGDNFNVSGLSVQFGTVTATIVGSPTASHVVVQVPPGLVPGGSTSSSVVITVNTDQGTVHSDDSFRAEQPAAAPAFVTAGPQFTPKLGAVGNSITLNGQNFNVAPVTVKFDTVNATIVGSPTATQIVAQVPSGVTPPATSKQIKISVTTPGGTALSADTFTVNG
jgi:hypothetical protein